MIKVTKVCAWNNRGNQYNLLPAFIVTPLVSVAEGYRLVPAGEFKESTVCEVFRKYSKRGVRIAVKFWTWHVGLEVGV